VQGCWQFVGRPFEHSACPKGFSCYPLSLDGTGFVLNGLISSEYNNAIIGKTRKPYRQNIVSHQAVSEFRDHLRGLQGAIVDVASEEVKGSLAYLHDIRTSVGVVLSCCQEVVDAGSGTTFEDKLGRSPDHVISLYNAISLLKEQLNLADIIPNPAAITYGRKCQSSINGFLFKMFKMFEPRFRRRGLNIEIQGYTRARIEAYNSLQFIPLILLDNALKYSAKGSTTYVSMHDQRSANLVEVRISSFGRIVPAEFRDKIFDKYVRGPNAVELNAQGMGLGLYIAQAIAAAHSFKIYYKSESPDSLTGTNDFFFQMRTCGYDE